MSTDRELPDPRLPRHHCSVCGVDADGWDATRDVPVCRDCARVEPDPEANHPQPDLSKLTPAERAAYEAVYYEGKVGRHYAAETDRSWGTVSKLLGRARDKLDAHGGGEGDE